ncbi:hypothetical protein K501DRAFT_272233 [Backusella circina FSU 941]|nr:hypothetical protein K501DRAFT_272233 [Backusella circina FSU 941]
MDEFSFDILYNIFTRLHFVNKLECMYVCRHWANVIREGSLLHTASIIQSEKITLDGFFDLIQDEPWRRKQVKKLVLGHTRWPYVHSHFRPDLLVNLKFLYLSKNMGRCKQYIQYLSPESVRPFMNHIQHVVDDAGADFVYELLIGGTCPRLTSLALRLNDYSGEDSYTNDQDEDSGTTSKHNQYLNKGIFSFLFNAPALRYLEFNHFDFQISDFEFIHASLMYLESLTIRGRVIHGNKLPDNVIPTGSLKRLSITDVSISPLSVANLVRYTIKKYTRLTAFTFDSNTGSLVKEADANAFMKKFAKQLTSLQLPLETDFVPWVCGFDCQLNTLAITQGCCIPSPLETLSRSPLRHHIQELKLSYASVFNTGPLKELTHLKNLHLAFSGTADPPDIDTISLLRNCPDKLTSLTLDHVTLKDKLTDMDHIFPIQELKINAGSLPQKFDLFLSKCCPKLRSLTLNGCLRAGDHINIDTLSLSYLKINLHDPKTKTRWFIVTPKSELFYYFDEYDDTYRVDGDDEDINALLYKACLPVKPVDLPKVETTTLSCRSVGTLIINDRITC